MKRNPLNSKRSFRKWCTVITATTALVILSGIIATIIILLLKRKFNFSSDFPMLGNTVIAPVVTITTTTTVTTVTSMEKVQCKMFREKREIF